MGVVACISRYTGRPFSLIPFISICSSPVGGSARSGTAAALKARDPEAKLSAAEKFAGEKALPGRSALRAAADIKEAAILISSYRGGIAGLSVQHR